MNNFNIAGRLVKDTEVMTSKSNKETLYCYNTVAINSGKDKVEYIDFTAFGKTAEILGQYGVKGKAVAITGYIHKNGAEKKYSTTLIAEKVSFLSKKE